MASTATPSAETTAVTVTGEQIAKPFRSAIQNTTSSLSPRPKLVGILANSNAPSRAYASWTAKACEAVGIEYELREVGIVKEGKEEGTAEQGEVEEAILGANEDDQVNGIMVYYPIFGPRQDGYLQQAVSPLKDVEGLNFTWYVPRSSNLDQHTISVSDSDSDSTGSSRFTTTFDSSTLANSHSQLKSSPLPLLLPLPPLSLHNRRTNLLHPPLLKPHLPVLSKPSSLVLLSQS